MNSFDENIQNKLVKDIFETINKYHNFTIVAHTKPDGDAIGSAFSTAFYLEKLGKNVNVILENFNEKFDILSGKKFLCNLDNIFTDVVISVDCASKDRLGANTQNLFENAKSTINIDHHISNTNFANINYVDAQSSSTSQVIYEIFNKYVETSKEIAECIYAGIIYDSGGFRFKSTSIRTMIIASELMKLDIDFNKIYTKIMFSNSQQETRALSRGLQNLVIEKENRIAYTYISINDMQNLDICTQDLDKVIFYLINIEDIKSAFFAYEIAKNSYKISLRSIGNINIGKVAQEFGGGGHFNAAGFSIDGNLEQIFKKIKEKLICEIKNYV